MKKLTVDAKLEKLSEVTEFVTAALNNLNCAPKTVMQVELVVEEIFVNIASYAYQDKDGLAEIALNFDDNPPVMELTFSDEGIPYNPLEKPDPDLNLPVEKRDIGGLGIFLIKKNVDEVNYEYRDGKNCLKVRKVLSVLKGGD